MTRGGVVAFFGPIDWVVDKVTGFVGDVATAGFELLIGGITAWVLDAVAWVAGTVLGFFAGTTFGFLTTVVDPDVQADWFITRQGPFGTMAAIGAVLLVGFLLAGITQGILSGDVAGMLRRMVLDVPVSVLGMVGLVVITQRLIVLTDELSRALLDSFGDDIATFSAVVVSVSRLGGGTATALVVVVLGLVAVFAGLILLAELAVRAALIYIVVALAPLVLAARFWPSFEGVAKRTGQLLLALILSKLVMALALAVAAAAAVGAGTGGAVTELPEPEVADSAPDNIVESVTQGVGILLAASTAFGVAAFSPLLAVRLLPLAEAAIVAQGIRGMPLRGAQQSLNMAYYSQVLGHGRMRQLTRGGGGPQPPGSPPAPSPSGSGGGPGSPRGPSPRGPGQGARRVPNRDDPAPTHQGTRHGRDDGSGRGAAGTARTAAPGAGSGAAGGAGAGGAAAGAAGAGVAAAGAVKRAGQAPGERASQAVDSATATSSGSGGAGPASPRAPGQGARRVPNRDDPAPPHPGTRRR